MDANETNESTTTTGSSTGEHNGASNTLHGINLTANNRMNVNVVNNVERDVDVNTRRRNNLNPGDRLFYALFMKIGQLYARLVPKKLRILLEIVVLLKVITISHYKYFT